MYGTRFWPISEGTEKNAVSKSIWLYFPEIWSSPATKQRTFCRPRQNSSNLCYRNFASITQVFFFVLAITILIGLK